MAAPDTKAFCIVDEKSLVFIVWCICRKHFHISMTELSPIRQSTLQPLETDHNGNEHFPMQLHVLTSPIIMTYICANAYSANQIPKHIDK